MKTKHLHIPGRSQPKWFDALILSLFTFLVTFQPYYLQQEINLYELGLYLPGIDTILRGQMPYRDCFHLRGPFELYVPAFMMQVFGANVAVLSTYFYIGTVVALIACVVLGAQLYRTRFLLYLMVPVLVARTFPRVAFTFWGGMRFALGLMAIAAAVQFFKTRKLVWLLGAGALAAGGLFTSVEIGVCAVVGVSLAVLFALFVRSFDMRFALRSILAFAAGWLLVVIPFLSYLAAQQALGPYLGDVLGVVTRMQTTFNLNHTMEIPNNLGEVLAAMFNPTSTNFKQMTPAYFYLVLLGYFVWKIRAKMIDNTDLAVVCLAGYGVMMYQTAFRHIWAYQFEMALQPEKVLYFFVLEQVYRYIKEKRVQFTVQRFKISVTLMVVIALIGSSLGYAFSRYGKRFVAYKYFMRVMSGKSTADLHPLHGKEAGTIVAERAKGMIAPREQVEEIDKLADFFDKNTQLGETVFIFPELGIYSFIIDRPFVGRYPMVTMAWFREEWHADFMDDLKAEKPRYAVVDKDPGPAFPAIFFKLESNKKKYDEVLDFIKANYRVVDETSGTWIYERRTRRGK